MIIYMRLATYLWKLPVAVWRGEPDKSRAAAEIDTLHQRLGHG